MDSFTTRLLKWYDNHARVLPWRIGPRDGKLGILPDPYHVWLSEVMLQQTTVATVQSFYLKFLKLWPSVEDLATAETDEVMQAWAGLGYYSRARNLKKCAELIVKEHGGKFPDSQDELQKLPGIGDYTSAAIATIAFGQPANVVDGNVERVVTRHTANSTPLPKVKDACRDFMEHATPEDLPGNFVQAMMDLGATICTPKNPACAICPVFQDCQSRARGTMLDYPVKAPKTAKPTRKGAAYVLQRNDGAIWLIKRPDKGLLGGMAAVPSTDWTSRDDGALGTDDAPATGDWRPKGIIRHTFTHFHLELEVWHATFDNTDVNGAAGWWSSQNKLNGEALPTVMKKAISAALPDAFKENIQ